MPDELTLDSIVIKAFQDSITVGAYLDKGKIQFDAAILKESQDSLTLDSILKSQKTSTFTTDSWIVNQQSSSISCDANIFNATQESISIDANIYVRDVYLIIDGTDYSEYLISSERQEKISRDIGSLTVEVDVDFPVTVNPYDQIKLIEKQQVVFDGYVHEVIKERTPDLMLIEGRDQLKRASDFWFSDLYTSNGETTVHWITRFLNMVGITNVETDIQETTYVYPDYGWEKMSALEAINTIVEMTPYQLIVQGDGTVTIKQTEKKLVPDYWLEDEFISFQRTVSDSTTRNRIVIFGTGFAVEQSETNDDLPSGAYWTAAAGNGVIRNTSTANDLANEMLEHMNKPLDVKKVEIEGSPNYKVGQTFRVIESKSNFDDTCILTSQVTRYNVDGGYTTELTFDEKFRNFWGWDRIDAPFDDFRLYAGTWGYGVWKSGGGGWENTNMGNKEVNAISVVGADEVWAVCTDGVYYTGDGGYSWHHFDMPLPASYLSNEDVNWADISGVYGAAYVLAGYGGGIWIYDIQGTDDSASIIKYRIN